MRDEHGLGFGADSLDAAPTLQQSHQGPSCSSGNTIPPLKMTYMGGCQNYGPFFGYPKYWVPYYNKDPKRDHIFDNHPYYKPILNPI